MPAVHKFEYDPEDMHLFVLSEWYKGVLIIVVLQALLLMVTGFLSGPIRMRNFDLDQMKERHGKEHKEATGNEVGDGQKGGYPDDGNGRYFRAAGYSAWYDMALVQRAHGHFMDSAAALFTCELLAGLYFPFAITAIGAIYFILRVLYIIGY